MKKSLSLILFLLILLGGCSLKKAAPVPPIPPIQPIKNEGPKTAVIKVYFGNDKLDPKSSDCGQVYPLEKQLAQGNGLGKAALNELFKGPSETEKAQGYFSLFSEKTQDALIGIEIKEDTAYVNLKDIRGIIPNASASCAGKQFLTEIDSTLMQFPTIKKVILAINGKPADFYEWMQIGCPKDGNLCDEAPFKPKVKAPANNTINTIK